MASGASVAGATDALYSSLAADMDRLLLEHVAFWEQHAEAEVGRQRRDDAHADQTVDNIAQRVYQYQPGSRKCRPVKSSGVASGANAMSYLSFISAVITLVLNINNNINSNRNNNNRVNLNYGNSNNLVSNLNQNVGNNFNLMFPPGRKRRRRRRRRSPSAPAMSWPECVPSNTGSLYSALIAPMAAPDQATEI